jgi:hypothetical protein
MMSRGRVLSVCAALVVLGACKGEKGEPGPTGPAGPQGPDGPRPIIATGGGLSGDGSPGAPLAVSYGTTAGTVAAGDHNHSFASLSGFPAVANPPVPGGASAAIVTGITVNAKADCASIAPAPHMEVYVNGSRIGGIDVTSSTYADSALFNVTPARYASEIAVVFTNDNQNGGCDHNLWVDHVTLTTAAGPITLRADDAAHVIYDRGTSYFDDVDVYPAQKGLSHSGALRFFIAPAAQHRPIQTAPGFVQSANWGYSQAGPVTAWTTLWSGNITVPDASTLWVSAQGHWTNSTGGGWCYATVMVDGVPAAAPCSTTSSSCSGAAHTYTTNWEALSHQAFFQVAPGTHSLGIGVVMTSGNTCSVNGARIFYAALPL